MKEPSRTSPFAAMTPQEQRHRWTVWQAQQQFTRPVENGENGKQTKVGSLREHLPEKREEESPVRTEQAKPERETAEQTTEHDLKPTQVGQTPLRLAIRHSQYDAVMKRMQQARKQAGHFASVEPSSTMQPSSGKP